MTFRMDPNDPRWKLAESEAFKVLSRLQDDDGFADAIHEASLRLGTNIKRRPIRPRSVPFRHHPTVASSSWTSARAGSPSGKQSAG